MYKQECGSTLEDCNLETQRMICILSNAPGDSDVRNLWSIFWGHTFCFQEMNSIVRNMRFWNFRRADMEKTHRQQLIELSFCA
jgi:hypothetical protein